MSRDDISHNSHVFRDCLLTTLTERLTPTKPERNRVARQTNRARSVGKCPDQALPSEPIIDTTDPADLVDFAQFISDECFDSLPAHFKLLSHDTIQNDPTLGDAYSLPLSFSTLEQLTGHIPPLVTDSLSAYGLISPPSSDLQTFMSPVLTAYISSVSAPPPKWAETRTSACQICERDWIPITYHHLIPKQIHAKVLKRGWHEESQLNSVAWLCRACHSFVHRMASNEELARDWYTVERICEREDVQKWAQWVRRVRWKKS